MAKGSKKPLVHSPPAPSSHAHVAGEPIVVPVVRDSHGNTTVRVDTTVIRGAERTLAVECAFVRKRHDLHEMLFVQLDPYDDTVVARVAVVRYTKERFVERAKQNEPFREALETHLNTVGRGKVGHYTELAQAARPRGGTTGYSAMLEAEMDLCTFAAQRAAVIFLAANSAEIAAVARGTAQALPLVPALEITLSSHALADFLWMWKALADTESGPA